MAWLILGVLLWIGAHLFKRALPRQRDALGSKGKGIVAVVILIGMVLMIIGYRAVDKADLYTLPIWAWYLNNVLMLIAIFLLDAGRVKGVVRTKVRHPMLSGVIVWSVAHLLVNGDVASLILFGGLGFWAVLETIVINRAEGAWQVPETGSILNDAKVMVVAAAVFSAIVGIHYWLGYSVLVFL